MKRWLPLALWLPAAAWADLRLEGQMHIGDEAAPEFTPADPLHCERHAAYPVNFYLSEDAAVTALTLHAAVDLDVPLTPEFDGVRRAASCPDCAACDGAAACGDVTLTLAAPLALNRGRHTLAVLDPNAPPGSCDGANDYGFAAITLHGADSAHVHFIRRRHLGDRADNDDDYDLDDDFQLYPDAPEGPVLTLPFTLAAPGHLAEIRLHRVRDLDTPAPLRIDGVAAGQVTGDGDAIVPVSLPLAAGAHTLEVAAGLVAGNPDDFSFDDVALILGGGTLNAPGVFNAVDPGADPVRGRIGTKVAGAPFTLDLVALGGGAPLLGYTGGVIVQLLDASASTGTVDLSGCDVGWTVVEPALAAATFTVPDEGRKTVTAVYPHALRVARVRVHDPVLGVSGCSADAFAIRPAGFGSIVASHADALSPGTAQGLAGAGFTGATQPTHRAGRPFTVQATAVNALGLAVTGYDGAPDLRAAGSALGSHAGAASASAWSGSGVVRSDNVRYFEAGAARLELGDTTFAAIDADDSPLAARRIGPTQFQVGRFTPDHFRFTPLAAEFLPGCTGFTYTGQPLTFAVAPRGDLVAASYGGAATRNYGDSALFKLPAALGAASYTALGGALVAAPPAPDNAVSNQGNGVARVTLLPLPAGALAFERGAPLAPFDAEIAITLGALHEADGVGLAAPARFGNAAPGEGVPFLGGARQMRFGRLVVDNAHGSERLPLTVPLRTEYWTGAGFAPAVNDHCTTLTDAPFQLSRSPAALATGVAGAPLALAFAAGRAGLPLTAPNATGTAALRADLTAALLPWLRGDWDGDGDYNEADGSGDPTARATFGIFRSNDRRIYQREVVR